MEKYVRFIHPPKHIPSLFLKLTLLATSCYYPTAFPQQIDEMANAPS